MIHSLYPIDSNVNSLYEYSPYFTCAVCAVQYAHAHAPLRASSCAPLCPRRDAMHQSSTSFECYSPYCSVCSFCFFGFVLFCFCFISLLSALLFDPRSNCLLHTYRVSFETSQSFALSCETHCALHEYIMSFEFSKYAYIRTFEITCETHSTVQYNTVLYNTYAKSMHRIALPFENRWNDSDRFVSNGIEWCGMETLYC